jgi:hypothetical protein
MHIGPQMPTSSSTCHIKDVCSSRGGACCCRCFVQEKRGSGSWKHPRSSLVKFAWIPNLLQLLLRNLTHLHLRSPSRFVRPLFPLAFSGLPFLDLPASSCQLAFLWGPEIPSFVCRWNLVSHTSSRPPVTPRILSSQIMSSETSAMFGC